MARPKLRLEIPEDPFDLTAVRLVDNFTGRPLPVEIRGYQVTAPGPHDAQKVILTLQNVRVVTVGGGKRPPSKFDVLRFLTVIDGPSVTMGVLCDEFDVGVPAMFDVVTDLVGRGLASFTSRPKDVRHHKLRATKLGRDHISRHTTEGGSE